MGETLLRECREEILGLKNRNNYLSTVEQELKDLQDVATESKMLCATLKGRLAESEKKEAVIDQLEQKNEKIQNENKDLTSKIHIMKTTETIGLTPIYLLCCNPNHHRNCF